MFSGDRDLTRGIKMAKVHQYIKFETEEQKEKFQNTMRNLKFKIQKNNGDILNDAVEFYNSMFNHRGERVK